MPKQPNTLAPACDHPELLTKDGLCHLCEQLEGQLDLLEDIQ